MTWANQIRILKQQFGALGAIIGQNFIYALKPVITALNTVMAKLIQFARVVSNSLGKIFGWKYEDTTGGIADDLEFGADAADDLSSGLGGAADKAKKLKQQLQGFDELNVLTTNTPSSGGGGGGGTLGDTDVSATGGQWVPDDEEKFFESNLDTLYKLGDHIGTTLTNQLRSIDWQEVYQGAKDFGSGLASFLNGLISPELFSETGKLIAGSLNTIIYTALSFGVTFDFIELGESIGEGINTFFTEFDYKAYAQTFNTWVGGILDGLITAFDTVNWDLVGTAIGDYLKEIDIVGLSTKLLTLAGKILSALGTALVSSFQTAPIETALITIFAGLKLVGIGTALTGALNTALAGGLSISVPKIVATVALLSIIADKASTSYTDDGGSNIWNTGVLSGAAAGIAKILGASNSVAITIGTGVGTAKAGGEIGLSLGEILSIESGDWELADYYANFKWSDLFDYSIDEYIDALDGYTSEFVDWIDDSIVTPSELKQAEKNWGNFGKLIGKDLANKIITTQKALKLLGVDTKKLNSITFDTMNEIKSSKNVWGSLSKAVPQYAETIKDGVTEQWDNLKTSTSNAYTWIKEKVLGETQTTANGMKVAYKSANDSIKITSADTTSDIVAKYKAMRENVVGNSDAMKNSVNRNSNSIKITSADTTSDIVAKYKAMRTNNEKEASTMATNVVGFLTKLKSGAETETKGLDSSLVSKFQNAKTGADTNFKGILNSVNTNIGGAKSIVEKQNWYSSGSNLVAGLAKGLSDKWNDTSGSGLVGKIVSLASGLTSALKRAFGIHSPSRLWDEEIGQMLPAGIGKGVLKGEDALNTDIINMGARLTDTMSGALTLATPCGLSSNFDFGVTSTMAHNISADTSMTSSVADGVRLGLSTTQAEQNALLREQNELLYQILQKESISSDDVYNVVVNKNRDIFNRTGTNPLFA